MNMAGTSRRFAPNPTPERPEVQDETAKIVDEIRGILRAHREQELNRLEARMKSEEEAVLKSADRQIRASTLTDAMRQQNEARWAIDIGHEEERKMLAARFQKLEAGLQLLQTRAQAGVGAEETRSMLVLREQQLVREIDEMTPARQALAEEKEKIERERRQFEGAKAIYAQKWKEVEEQLANTDLLDRMARQSAAERDLEARTKAFEVAMQELVKRRTELDGDCEALGQKRVELDAETEFHDAKRRELKEAEQAMGEKVGRDIAAAFETFVMGLVRREPAPVKPVDAVPDIPARKLRRPV